MGYMDQFRRPTGRQGKIVAALMNRGHKALTTWGLTHVIIEPSNVILDVGCGGGKTVNRLAQTAPKGKVYGIDHSSDMVTYAKKVNKKLIKQNRVEIFEASVEKTNLPSNCFDLVIAVETYYFWTSLPEVFREILRMLKLKGKFLIINEMVKDGFYDVEKAEMIRKAHVKLFELDEIGGMLQSAGFVGVEVFRKENSAWNTVYAEKPSI